MSKPVRLELQSGRTFASRGLATRATVIGLLWGLFWGGHVSAATIEVGSNGCSLADAIVAANTDAPQGGCPAGAGADEITLPADADIALGTGFPAPPAFTGGLVGLPIVSSEIRILGNGATVRRMSGAADFPLFLVAPAGVLDLRQLTIANGASVFGGAIINDQGELRLDSCTVEDSSASMGGGGILNVGGTTTLNRSTVSGSSAVLDGGGIFNFFGALVLSQSTVSNNSSGNLGGGMFNNQGVMTLNNSTVSGNSSNAAGGIFNGLGSTYLVNSTVTDNSAGTGAGVGSFGDSSSFTEITASLISGNQGGDVDLVQGAQNSLFSGGDNLIGNTNGAGIFTQPGDQVGVLQSGTGPLADNGGATQTHSLLPGSPAIDAVTRTENCPDVDQRESSRPRGLACDIGAYEFGLSATLLEAEPLILLRIGGLLNLRIQGQASARLTGAGTGEPIPGQGIEFRSRGGHTLCNAVTDGNGRAGCSFTVTGLLSTTLSLGYVANFAGDQTFDASSDTAPLLSVGTK